MTSSSSTAQRLKAVQPTNSEDSFGLSYLKGDLASEKECRAWLAEEIQFHNAAATLTHSGTIPDFSSYDEKYHRYNEEFGLGNLLMNGGKVLDFGCADGRGLTRFPRTFHYYGADVSSELLQLAQHEWPKGEFAEIPGTGHVPWEDETFDGVVCLGVLHHVPRVGRTLAELSRVLRPGGWLFVREPVTDMTRLSGSRVGLSPRERGIPPTYFSETAPKANLHLVSTRLAGLGGLNQLKRAARSKALEVAFHKLDVALCGLHDPAQIRYHRTRLWQKFAPTFAFYLFRKTTN